MYERRAHDGRQSVASGEENAGGSPVDGLTIGRVVCYRGRYPVVAGSSLFPSQPGCAGDTGTVSETRIVDVIEDPAGLMHITDGSLGAKPGDAVFILRNADRRDRLERIHLAEVLVCMALKELDIEVVSVEVAAGMAWVETTSAAPPIDLATRSAESLEVAISPQSGGGMVVRIGEQSVISYLAPISRSTDTIGAAGVRPVAEGDAGGEVLEITLPDGEGRSWWE